MKYIDTHDTLINCEHIVLLEIHQHGKNDYIRKGTFTVEMKDPIKGIHTRETPVLK